MFRKLVLAAVLAFGMGGGVLATQGAEAAVVHPAAPATLIQAIEQGAPAASGVQQAYYHGYYHRPYYHPPYYHRRRVCAVRRVRVHTAYGWRWVSRRTCWWR
ncbi:hypothetical protein ACMDCR_22990 [Labrys okinawensis]|uniref:hypothetical protein n=1 Tax=Labrys okinawensis TaxID=346911 RepID=UPI0039BD4121